MSEAKFTKGEWGVEIGCSQAFVTTDNKFIHESNVDVALGDRAERVANAHLIAAAPEMYSELEELSGIIRRMGVDSASDRIDQLLKKARGEK